MLPFAGSGEGGIKAHQYLLPIHKLVKYLDPRVLDYLNTNPLSVVRTMALAQNRFAMNHKLMPPSDTRQDEWDALIYGKWLDPIMSIIACYEIIRRGQVPNQIENVKTVIGNLRKYFPWYSRHGGDTPGNGLAVYWDPRTAAVIGRSPYARTQPGRPTVPRIEARLFNALDDMAWCSEVGQWPNAGRAVNPLRVVNVELISETRYVQKSRPKAGLGVHAIQFFARGVVCG